MTRHDGMDSTDFTPGTTLCPADQAAMDALADAGFEIQRVSPEHRERAVRLLHAMGLLAADPHQREATIHSCCGRIALARAQHEQADLVPQDEDALEALVQHGYEPRRVSAAVRERATRLAGLLSTLTAASARRREDDAAGKDALIVRTLGAVQTAIETERRAMQISNRTTPTRRWRVPDVVSIAALLLIGVAVTWPVMSAIRERARMNLNESNLRNVGLGMGMYSGANNGSLPMATASLAGTSWWNVGRAEQSNSANLFTLAREGYTCPGAFAAPGNPEAAACQIDLSAMDWKRFEEVPYSYQNQFAARRPVWRQSPDMIVVGDRSPVIVKAIRGQWVDPLENSPNSGGRGQHVLMLDGGVSWMTRPVTRAGDNIWLPKPIEDLIQRAANQRRAAPLQGTEQPDCETDVFLVP